VAQPLLLPPPVLVALEQLTLHCAEVLLLLVEMAEHLVLLVSFREVARLVRFMETAETAEFLVLVVVVQEAVV
jgi:hypothetical protein